MNLKRLVYKYILGDFLTAIATWLLFCIFRAVSNDMLVFEEVQILTPSFNFWLSITFFPICYLFVSYLTGFYDSKGTRSRILELFATFIGSLVASLVAFFVILLDDIVVSYRFYYQSFLFLFGTCFFLSYMVRLAITQSYFHKIKTNKIWFNMLIIGTGESAKKAEAALQKKIRFYGKRLIGFVQVGRSGNGGSVAPVLGNLNQIGAIIKKYDIKSAIVALKNTDEHTVFPVINKLIQHNIEINIVPNDLEILTGRISINDIDAMPYISFSNLTMSSWQRAFKRVFDIVASLFCLFLLMPLFVVVAIRIRIESKGAVLYHQERIGRNGKPFTLHKFRSMYDKAENGIPRLTEENDKRITPFGRTMRKYRIDELPQLYNILKGEMSFVGPRPERSYFIRQIMKEVPYYCLIYKVQPGLLSWGPIKVGYTHTIEEMKERLNYDIIYMDNMSLFNDIKIILYSFEVVFKGKGI